MERGWSDAVLILFCFFLRATVFRKSENSLQNIYRPKMFITPPPFQQQHFTLFLDFLNASFVKKIIIPEICLKKNLSILKTFSYHNRKSNFHQQRVLQSHFHAAKLLCIYLIPVVFQST